MATVELLPVEDVTACCTPVTEEALDRSAAELLAKSLKAIADPTRLQLISLVAAHDGAEACVCDLQEPLGLSQPTVSHHLKRLTEAGLLDKVRVGRTVTHQVRPELFAELRTVLQMD